MQFTWPNILGKCLLESLGFSIDVFKEMTYLNELNNNLNDEDIYKEDWKIFGQTLENYILKNKEKLEKKLYRYHTCLL
ncbi:MAG: hypothetical protein BWY74_02872 [Firmicutes bacterium ADurb.Bin419]|nr:MAG: hypothetical protein BWY74_02872 [Firmicutes bacterium ADurb.Bin419]